MVDEAAGGEQRDDPCRRLFGRLLVAGDDQLGRLRRLVVLIDASEILDISGDRSSVQPLGIARDALLKRRIDENLDEFILAKQFAHHDPLGPKGRDEGAKRNEPGLRHELCDFANPADVFNPVGFRKAQILVEPVPHIVAVEQDGMDAMGVKPGFDKIGDRRFARAGKASEPQHGGFVMLDAGTVLLIDAEALG